MSGPKRADVEAQLNVARDSQQKCATLISQVEDAAISQLLVRAERDSRLTDNLIKEIEKALRDSGAVLNEMAPESTRILLSLKANAEQKRRATEVLLVKAREAVKKAQQEQAAATTLFEQANAEYKRVIEALAAKSGSHYMHSENEMAKQAKVTFDRAAAQMAAGESIRHEATHATRQALLRSTDALSTVQEAADRLRATRDEVEARQRAEIFVRQIAEEKGRKATLVVETAGAALNRLNSLPHDRFQPGVVKRLREEFHAAQTVLAQGQFEAATIAADQLHKQANDLENKIGIAWRDWERRRTEAEAKVITLKVCLEGIEESFIRQWGNDAAALSKAQVALQVAQNALQNEQFEAAGKSAERTRETVEMALHSAAQNKADSEKREGIVHALSGALQELGFEVSLQPGTLSEPYCIGAQTPDENGRGDVVIAIPLKGEVNFEVKVPEGDLSCISSIKELMERLKRRGVEWNVTDWGYAEGANLIMTQKDTVQEKEKEKQKAKR